VHCHNRLNCFEACDISLVSLSFVCGGLQVVSCGIGVPSFPLGCVWFLAANVLLKAGQYLKPEII
jgi:hypothetical protein